MRGASANWVGAWAQVGWQAQATDPFDSSDPFDPFDPFKGGRG
jgi:hypothetical protein